MSAKLLLVYLVLASLAADIPAVPSSWLQIYFFFSTWSRRSWLQNIPAVPNSWVKSYFSSTWSCRPWLQIFQLFRTADYTVTSFSLPGLALLVCGNSNCSETANCEVTTSRLPGLAVLGLDIPAVPNSWFKSYYFFSTCSCPPWLQIFKLFRTADCKPTSSSLPGLAVLGCRYSSCSEQLIAKLLLLYLVLPS